LNFRNRARLLHGAARGLWAMLPAVALGLEAYHTGAKTAHKT